MHLLELVGKAINAQDFALTVDIGQDISKVIEDGQVTSKEVIDTVHSIVEHGLELYGKSDVVVFDPSKGTAAAIQRMGAALRGLEEDIRAALEKGVTASELNDLTRDAFLQILGVFVNIAMPLAYHNNDEEK